MRKDPGKVGGRRLPAIVDFLVGGGGRCSGIRSSRIARIVAVVAIRNVGHVCTLSQEKTRF